MVKNTSSYRTTYEFGHSYRKENTNVLQSTHFGGNEMAAFFGLITFFDTNKKWVEHAKVKAEVFSKVPTISTLSLIPADDTPYSIGKLHELGVGEYADDTYKDKTDPSP